MIREVWASSAEDVVYHAVSRLEAAGALAEVDRHKVIEAILHYMSRKCVVIDLPVQLA